MQVLVADESPPTLSDRAKFAGYGLLPLVAGLFLFRLAPTLADPSWTPSTHRMRYLMD